MPPRKQQQKNWREKKGMPQRKKKSADPEMLPGSITRVQTLEQFQNFKKTKQNKNYCIFIFNYPPTVLASMDKNKLLFF